MEIPRPAAQCCTGKEFRVTYCGITMEYVQHLLVVNIQDMDTFTAEISASFAKGHVDGVCYLSPLTLFAQ
jgi:hypothetical protein